jgi:hypothetical protein
MPIFSAFGYLQFRFFFGIVLFDCLSCSGRNFFREMLISEILALEQENSNIILHKEGLFIRAYERSAYLFATYIN